ncbi:MAG: hypothetical protein K2N21_03180 [Rikenellaceae bacterium]|nr:hypothetical protein [Rikenellaceae bacterium]
MKFKLLSLVAILMASAGVASAQDYNSPEFEKYGATAEERKENALKYNFLGDAYRQKDWALASKYLNELLQDAPGIGQNLYIMGGTIYKNKIATSRTKEERLKSIDSLLIVYDKRAEQFGDHPTRGRSYIYSEKAKDFINYRPSEINDIIKHTTAAIEASGNNPDLDLAQAYFNALVQAYRDDEIETVILLNEYDKISNAVAASSSQHKADVTGVIDQLFVQSGAATCENLEIIFKPQIESDPENLALVSKVARYLSRNNCNGDFSAAISHKLYQLDPTAESAFVIAGNYADSKQYDEAYKYYDEAIEMASEADTKANYAIRASSVALIAQNGRKAADYARKAIANNSENGLGHFLLAQAYATGLSQCSGFERQMAACLVYDQMVNARNHVTDADQLETINKAIASYPSYFPSAEEVFFRTLSKGDSYTVSCGWLTGTTTIRTKN